MNKATDKISINYGIKVFNEFNEALRQEWDSLYAKGANYNLSFKWCQLWFKYFKRKRDIYIITFWEDNDLKLLAPFYIYRNRLSLIGTKPDLYDEFNILYSSPKYIDKLLEFIEQNKFEINFKHLSSDTEFAKILIKRFSGHGVKQISGITETKPHIKISAPLNKNAISDVKRCKKNAQKYFKQDIIFNYSAERKEEYIKEFIAFHKQRWNGGMLVKKAYLVNFIEEILKDPDLTVLSRASFSEDNITLAFGLGYLDSNKRYWLSMSVYNAKYNKVSPGKVMLYDLITESFNRGISHFDFGRGSEPYKSWFSNGESILFNIETYNSKIFVIKILNLIGKILKKISG